MAVTAEEIQLARLLIPRAFPRLGSEPFQVKSPRTAQYNCIGWAAGDDQNVWWPGGKYRPNGARPDESVAAFVTAFETRGYERCDSADLESGFQKVALYADAPAGRVTHAARQLADGQWTSKLGAQWDINHSLEGVCGPCPAYGRAAQILKRKIPQRAPS